MARGGGCNLACDDDIILSSLKVRDVGCIVSCNNEGRGRNFGCRTGNKCVNVFSDVLSDGLPRVSKVVEDGEDRFDGQDPSSERGLDSGGQEYIKAGNGRGVFAIVYC